MRGTLKRPIMPPGDSEAAIASCASLSQLFDVAEAALTEAIAMARTGTGLFRI